MTAKMRVEEWQQAFTTIFEKLVMQAFAHFTAMCIFKRKPDGYLKITFLFSSTIAIYYIYYCTLS
jgi:hypothetical protein